MLPHVASVVTVPQSILSWCRLEYLILNLLESLNFNIILTHFHGKVFTEKDEDFERDRGAKELGTIGRSTSKAHLSMSQYLDRCALYST